MFTVTLFSFFFWVLVFVIILYFLPFSVFLSYFSFLYFSHFSNFVSFTFNSISILSIFHFIFLLNISVLFFSLCARLNWQFVCQFLSANLWLYCIVLTLFHTLGANITGLKVVKTNIVGRREYANWYFLATQKKSHTKVCQFIRKSIF